MTESKLDGACQCSDFARENRHSQGMADRLCRRRGDFGILKSRLESGKRSRSKHPTKPRHELASRNGVTTGTTTSL